MLAPLVPEFINEQVGWLVAVVIGFGFGFSLEQAGFSSTRKMAGLFYGYDFTVLRVFFTAGVTAMLGTLIFAKLGWLDIELIYINPTYLYAAIIGGCIMGLGFILGGFCPGTSIVAFSIGRIDALFFVIGGAVGIFLFGEFFPFFSDWYTKEYLGAPLVGDWLKVSKETVAIGTVFIALFAFGITYMVEQKVNMRSIEWKSYRMWGATVGFSLLLFLPALYIVLTPEYKEKIWQEATQMKIADTKRYQAYVPDKLAYQLLHPSSKSIQVIDLRDSVDFSNERIPTAVNIPLRELLDSKWEVILKKKNQINVFYAKQELSSQQACFIAERMGYSANVWLEGGWAAYKNSLINVPLISKTASMQDEFDYRFRSKAKQQLEELGKKHLAKPIIKPKKKLKIQGGCS